MSTSEKSQSTHLHVGVAKDQVNGNFQGLRLEVGREEGRPKRMSDKFGTWRGRKKVCMYVGLIQIDMRCLFQNKL